MVVNAGIRKVLERLPPRCPDVSVEEARAELARLDGRRWAVLDFETASFHEPRVIEVGLVASDGTVLMDELVDPRIPITTRVTEIHGLTDTDVAGADAWPAVQARLGRVLREAGIEVVVAFNTSFEAMCLAYNAEAYGIAGLEVELVCMQRVALGLLGPGESGWLSLRRACEEAGVEEVPTHRAVADCVATIGLQCALRRTTAAAALDGSRDRLGVLRLAT
ncbi:MAG: 3'-5' exonuclease [Myxococcota bacterium]